MAELPSNNFSPEDFFDFSSRSKDRRRNERLNIMYAGDIVQNFETLNNNNSIQITAGNYSAYMPNVVNTTIVGTGNVIFNPSRLNVDPTGSSAMIGLDTKVSNVRFEGTVLIDNEATAIFHNCVFTDTITLTLRSKANFIGCLFQDVANIQAVSVLSIAYINGCSKKSSVAHVGITATYGETT